MNRAVAEESIAALERENRIIKRKLARSEANRALTEEAFESYLEAVQNCRGPGRDGDARCVMADKLRAEIEQEFLAKALANEKLHRLDRLNLVGQMAASIGHEVRNPLTTVRGYLQLFESKRSFAQYRDALWLMIEELDRANAIITNYLSLAKNKRVDLQPGKLEEVLQALKPALQRDAIRKGHTLEFDLQATPAILMDKWEIRQLVCNLVQNGLEAMGKQGRISVRTAGCGGSALLAVEDSGEGMVPEVMEKLGTPFFTTKRNGSGLGLAVSYRIVEHHRGSIRFDSSPAGTTVTTTFPVPPQLM